MNRGQKKHAKQLRRRRKLAMRREAPTEHIEIAELVQELMDDFDVDHPDACIPDDVVETLEVPGTALAGYGAPHWDLCVLFETAGEATAKIAAQHVALPGDTTTIAVLWSPSAQKAFLEPGTSAIWQREGEGRRIACVMSDGRTVFSVPLK